MLCFFFAVFSSRIQVRREKLCYSCAQIVIVMEKKTHREAYTHGIFMLATGKHRDRCPAELILDEKIDDSERYLQRDNLNSCEFFTSTVHYSEIFVKGLLTHHFFFFSLLYFSNHRIHIHFGSVNRD